MNALSRPLFSAPPEMVEGSGITSMAMGEEQGMPMGGEQAALDIGGMIAGQLAAGIDQTERNIEAVPEDDTGGLMNALRDKDASVEDYRDELADIVGPKDAAATPESVLALVQPTLAMMEMEQGIGAMNGAMGDMGAMGGMGEDMALMGGMGGGIGDMMSQGLPQGLPMPMGDDMVAVQEEVVGRMPPVEGMQRGGVVSIPAGKKSLPFDPNDPSVQHFALGGLADRVREGVALRESLMGDLPDRREDSTLSKILQVFGPGVAGALSPGGIPEALNQINMSSRNLLNRQREEDIARDRLEYGTNAANVQGALTTALAQDTAAEDAQNKLKIAAAGRTGDKPPEYAYFLKRQEDLNIQLGIAKKAGDNEGIKRITTMIDGVQGRLDKLSGENAMERLATSIHGREEARAKADLARTNFESNQIWSKENISFEEKQVGDLAKKEEVANLSNLAAGIAKEIDSGPGRDIQQRLTETIKKFERFGLPTEFVNSVTDKYLVRDKSYDQAEFLRSIANRLVLQFTSLFPGNLNAEEVRIAKGVASGELDMTPGTFRMIANLSKKVLARAQRKQNALLEVRTNFLNTHERGEIPSQQVLNGLYVKRINELSQEEFSSDTSFVKEAEKQLLTNVKAFSQPMALYNSATEEGKDGLRKVNGVIRQSLFLNNTTDKYIDIFRLEDGALKGKRLERASAHARGFLNQISLGRNKETYDNLSSEKKKEVFTILSSASMSSFLGAGFDTALGAFNPS